MTEGWERCGELLCYKQFKILQSYRQKYVKRAALSYHKLPYCDFQIIVKLN